MVRITVSNGVRVGILKVSINCRRVANVTISGQSVKSEQVERFPLPFPSLPSFFLTPSFPLPLPIPSLPLEVGPLKSSKWIWGSTVSSRSGV